MQNIIIAFAKEEDAQNFRRILTHGGFDTNLVCSSGAQALSMMEDLGNGVVVCGYRLSDMIYSELAENLPNYFQMLLIASQNKVAESEVQENVVFLPTPLHKEDLYSSLSMMIDGVAVLRKKSKKARMNRTAEQQKTIDDAKTLLMERNHMSEPEAHKYLQKCSMDSSTSLLEAAEMVISLGHI